MVMTTELKNIEVTGKESSVMQRAAQLNHTAQGTTGSEEVGTGMKAGVLIPFSVPLLLNKSSPIPVYPLRK